MNDQDFNNLTKEFQNFWKAKINATLNKGPTERKKISEEWNKTFFNEINKAKPLGEDVEFSVDVSGNPAMHLQSLKIEAKNHNSPEDVDRFVSRLPEGLVQMLFSDIQENPIMKQRIEKARTETPKPKEVKAEAVPKGLSYLK